MLSAKECKWKIALFDQLDDERVGDRIIDFVNQLPPELDRGDIYKATTEGVSFLHGYLFLDPTWCRKRDKALDEIGQAIDRFKQVLREWPRYRDYPVWCDRNVKAWHVVGPVESTVAQVNNHPIDDAAHA